MSGQDAEIGNVGDQGASPQYETLAKAVTDNNPRNVDAALMTMRKAGIRYIIYTGDLGGLDTFKYPFLTAPSLKKLYESTVDNQSITLLQL
jgi:hypothetical protein